MTGQIAAPPASGRHAGASFLTATTQSARRIGLAYVRTPQLLVMPPVMGASFLLVFRYIFGGALHTGGSVDYVEFLVPGFLVAGVVWTAMNIPAGVAEDAASGVHDRLRSLPIPRAAVMAGRSLADMTLNIVALAISALLGFAVGFRAHAGPAAMVAGFSLILAAIYAFTWAFISLGLVAANAQAAQALASLVALPFAFVSGAFVPVDSMPDSVQWFAANQPVTVIANAVRSLMLGGTHAAGVSHGTGHWALLSLLWCAGIIAVFGTIAVIRFGRSR